MGDQNIGAAGGWVILGSGVALICIGAIAAPGMSSHADVGRLAYLPTLLVVSGIAAAVTGMVPLVKHRRGRS